MIATASETMASLEHTDPTFAYRHANAVRGGTNAVAHTPAAPVFSALIAAKGRVSPASGRLSAPWIRTERIESADPKSSITCHAHGFTTVTTGAERSTWRVPACWRGDSAKRERSIRVRRHVFVHVLRFAGFGFGFDSRIPYLSSTNDAF